MSDGTSTKLDAVRRIKPDDLRRAFNSGEAKLRRPLVGGMTEQERRAEEIFGADFLGRKALEVFGVKCRRSGFDVKFAVDFPDRSRPIDLDDVSMQNFRNDQLRDWSIILRPSKMMIDHIGVDITINSLFELFGDRRLSDFGSPIVIEPLDWKKAEPFANEPLKGGYVFCNKSVDASSLDKSWQDQEDCLFVGEERRSPVEAVWDHIFYRTMRGANIHQQFDEVTSGEFQATTHRGEKVAVRSQVGSGIRFAAYRPDKTMPNAGVIPQITGKP